MSRNESTPDASNRARFPPVVHCCLREVERVLDEAGAEGESVVVAVSGGGDSMALLEVAGLLAGPRGLRLHVASVNHGLRPECRDEVELVRGAAARWKASFHALDVKPGAADENSMRRARHGALDRIRRDVGARYVLLGHSADDQIETVLFRFLRGAGPGGLAGMREIRPPLLRPLLSLRRAQLRELLRLRDVGWVEDPTNESERYARGRLRRSVMPAIEAAFGRGVLDHLLDVAPRWRDDEDFLEAQAARLLAWAARGDDAERGPEAAALDADTLASAHPALRARALRRWIEAATGHGPGSREVAAVENWLAGAHGSAPAGRVDVAGATIVGERGLLRIRTGASTKQRPEEAQRSAAGPAEEAKVVLPASEARVTVPRG